MQILAGFLFVICLSVTGAVSIATFMHLFARSLGRGARVSLAAWLGNILGLVPVALVMTAQNGLPQGQQITAIIGIFLAALAFVAYPTGYVTVRALDKRWIDTSIFE